MLVVVVAYGSEHHLRGCLETLGPGFRVLVVDNGGSTRARDICATLGADYLRTAKNIGFAAAVNLAIELRRESGMDVLLLNPDARLSPTDVGILRDRLHSSNNVAAVGPRLLGPDGDSQKASWPVPSPWMAMATIIGAGEILCRRRFVNGAVLLLRGTAIDMIGSLDERFFLYSEEADWQLRAFRAGWTAAVVQEAVAVHLGGGTSSDPVQRELLFNASAERFIRKWYGSLGWQVFRAASILAALRRLLTSHNDRRTATYRRRDRSVLARSDSLCGYTKRRKVRIAHVVRSDSFAGVERYICLVAPRLAARGCEVTVIGGNPSNMLQMSETVRFRPASSTFGVATELARLGRMDIVHVHMTAAELAALFTKPRHRARLVATLHFASRRGSGIVDSPLRLLDGFIDEQIAISHFVKTAVPAARVLVNGVELADPGPQQRQRSVLVMQRLEPEKHTDVALRAWSASNLRRKGWRLLIAGRGSELLELRRLAHHLDLEESTEWLGFVQHPSELLSSAGLLLATAPEEPFGLTVVEAMARATPVVATDGGAHPETVGCDGWLFPVDDVAACARELDQAGHRDLADYGHRLRSRQRQLFDIDAHTEALLQIYHELMG